MKKHPFIDFLKSRQCWHHVRIALALFFGIILFSTLFLKIFTRHNQKLVVPDFKALTYIDAVKVADDNNFQCVLSDSVYNTTYKPGTVVEQEPKAGSKVKSGRRIFLIMNAFNPEKIKMPNVVGVSLRQASAILETYGLTTGILRYIPDIATNNVLRQRYKSKEINPGEDVIKGSRIDLVIGMSASSHTSQVPMLLGEDLSKARHLIVESYHNMGIVVFDGSVKTYEDSVKAVVFRQRPDPITTSIAIMGTYIDLWLTTDHSKVKPAEPNE